MINARAPRWLQSFSEASATTTAISVRAALSSYVHCLLPTWRLWPPCAVSARCPWWRVDLYSWPPADLGDVPQDFEAQCLTSSSTIMGDPNCPIFTSATQSLRDGRPQTALQSTAPSNPKQHKRSVIAQDLQTCDAYSCSRRRFASPNAESQSTIRVWPPQRLCTSLWSSGACPKNMITMKGVRQSPM